MSGGAQPDPREPDGPRPPAPASGRRWTRHVLGGTAVVAMSCIAVLAHGVPGVAEGVAPAEAWMELNVPTHVALDARVVVVASDREARDLVRDVLAARGRDNRSRAARRVRAANSAYARDFRVIARREAVRAGISDPELFVRQIAAESGYQPCARSGAGAIGIAQIMPDTARGWKVDPHIPQDALRAAAEHMSVYERQLGSYRLALAAYNAGPGAVAEFGGVPPYAETQEYIRRILDRSTPLAGLDQVYRPPTALDDGFRRRLMSLVRDVRAHGGTLGVEEGWRSYDDSMRIWIAAKRRYGGWSGAKKWAAPPGCSNHVRGLAADLTGDLALAARLAPKWGLVVPMSWEPWHIERSGIATQSG